MGKKYPFLRTCFGLVLSPIKSILLGRGDYPIKNKFFEEFTSTVGGLLWPLLSLTPLWKPQYIQHFGISDNLRQVNMVRKTIVIQLSQPSRFGEGLEV